MLTVRTTDYGRRLRGPSAKISDGGHVLAILRASSTSRILPQPPRATASGLSAGTSDSVGPSASCPQWQSSAAPILPSPLIPAEIHHGCRPTAEPPVPALVRRPPRYHFLFEVVLYKAGATSGRFSCLLSHRSQVYSLGVDPDHKVGKAPNLISIIIEIISQSHLVSL